ncbi:hypothetical protein QBC38DRAFT_531397 [Podospora fimiseda]|uniref:Uncharacterized protein n=1 Tax=Podospora fimiseda TaxID=252190 RepID=A0AAN7GVC6_9PEZI|nr:hypothetical protein QBC38DRAFT_531397 [Podospora fimiseda]
MKFITIILTALSMLFLPAQSPAPSPRYTPKLPPPPCSISPPLSPLFLGTASGGALDATPAAPPANALTTPGPNLWITVMTNIASVDLITLHMVNVEIKDGTTSTFPTPNGGLPTAGNFAGGSTYSLLVPTGWAGRVAFNKAGSPIVGDESLIEDSYMMQKNTSLNYPLGDVDVSYVDGYTYPITCKCRASGPKLTGCVDPKLWQQGKDCPGVGAGGACRNPIRDEKMITYAHEWFAPCAGRLYTFPMDDKANSNGQCQSGTVDCEIHPK